MSQMHQVGPDANENKIIIKQNAFWWYEAKVSNIKNFVFHPCIWK